MGRRRIVVAITGASGVAAGVLFLRELKKTGMFEIHTVCSRGAVRVAMHEMGISEENFISRIKEWSDHVYGEHELSAPISSGTFRHDGMVVLPCSMKTLALIACGAELNLIIRAASVTLKEGRKLVLCVRETPLRKAHIENMLRLAQEGAVILPIVMSFYGGKIKVSKSTSDSFREDFVFPSGEAMIKNIIGKVMDQIGVNYDYERWC